MQFSSRSNIHTLSDYSKVSLPFETPFMTPKEYLLLPTIILLYYTIPLIITTTSITALFVLAIYNVVMWSCAFYLSCRQYTIMILFSVISLSMLPILALNTPFHEVSLLRTIGISLFFLFMEDALSNSVSTVIRRLSLSPLSDYLGRTTYPGMRVSPYLESLILAVITNFLNVNVGMSFIITPLIIGRYLRV